MPDVVRAATFRSPGNVLLRRSYGQKYEWRAHRERLQSREQPTVTSEDGTKTLRFRPNASDGQSSLPLPPIMDPKLVAGKQRFGGHGATPKNKLSREAQEEMSEFSKAFAANPFAHALATPIRTCTTTQARLPSHFLQPFSAHFRMKDQTLNAYVSPTTSHTSQSETQLESTLGGHAVDTAPSKSYVFNSAEVINMVDRKRRKKTGSGDGRKKHVPSLVTQRMAEAFEKKVSALPSGGRNGGWTFLGSEEIVREMLVGDVCKALCKYLENVPGCTHLISDAKLEGREHAVIPDLGAARCWRDATRSGTQSTGDADTGVLAIPAYDVSRMQLSQPLSELNLPSEVKESSILGVLLDRQTLKLHLALQRLAMFLGAKTACQFIVTAKEESLVEGHNDLPILPFLWMMDGDAGYQPEIEESEPVVESIEIRQRRVDSEADGIGRNGHEDYDGDDGGDDFDT